MYNVIIRMISKGRCFKEVKRNADTRTLKALRTIHGYDNVIICL